MTPPAVQIASQRTVERPLIAIVMDTAVSFDREIIAGAAQYAREAGDWQLYVEEERGHRLPNLDEWNGQGILASFDDPEVVKAIVASGVPAVAVGGMGCYDPALGIPRVATDHGQIATLAADHFLERGLEAFGYYGPPDSNILRWSRTRADAFAGRVAEAGFACDCFTAVQGPEDWSRLQHDLSHWLAALPKPVGVMACDDSRARHVLEACRTQGFRVPHDVAVIGVDDDELICELAVPRLTSIRQAARRIGYEAARLLDAQLSGPTGASLPPTTSSILVPPIGIVPRASTDTLAVRDPAIAHVIRTIRERACRGLTVEELAAVSGLVSWKLEKSFKEIVGHSVHDDIVRVRLAEVQRLLRSTDLPLKAVAPRTGFHSVPYLITVFRRHFGITPARFRRLETDRTVAAIDGVKDGE